MKIKEGYILRQVAGNNIVIAVGDAAVDFNGLITINSAGAFLWNRLTEGATEEELLDAMLAEYDVDRDTAKKDIDEFLEKLQKADLIVYDA
ncbi:MAG TPA: PqqD family protein [Candidatus Avimonoglobus intestinipullorum]|uniref:PqqD family protein n=1 Tax=Candidatus Avimonoglobus intestinipullorum TaxID=2840699 RepID=A0A9D1LUE0_9FIRM|nr:PqqD family protein [Candidatus Avimonoglobus intestinipullorum]